VCDRTVWLTWGVTREGEQHLLTASHVVCLPTHLTLRNDPRHALLLAPPCSCIISPACALLLVLLPYLAQVISLATAYANSV
jgi:hypothetical protein